MSADVTPLGCVNHPATPTQVKCSRCLDPICIECMNSADIGFHCPKCKKGGQRRFALRGNVQLSSGDRRQKYLNPIVNLFIVINAGIYFFHLFGVLDRLVYEYALNGIGVAIGQWERIPFSWFIHIGFLHLLFNMAFLWIYGLQLERMLGSIRFFVVYVFSALAGSAAVLWFGDIRSFGIGASGAIFGILGCLLVVFHKRFIDASGIYFVLILNTLIGFAIPNVEWRAHLGGMFAGLLIGWIFTREVHKGRIMQVFLIVLSFATVISLIYIRKNQILNDVNQVIPLFLSNDV